MEQVVLASVAFVGFHFLLSHPLRAPIVARIGEGPFLGLYSLVAFVTLGWIIFGYRAAPAQPPLWFVDDTMWAIASAAMLIASVLMVGSLLGNPALPDPTGRTRNVPEPRGVFAITRHPMMWSFALWALVHIAIYPVGANIVVAAAILILALVGARLQDAKKARLQPEFWREWEARTSFWPFAKIAGHSIMPRFGIWAGGIALWLVATWAHWPLAGWDAGIWRWIA